MQDEKELLENQLTETQTMLTNLSNQYRSRLEQYIQDIKVCGPFFVDIFLLILCYHL